MNLRVTVPDGLTRVLVRSSWRDRESSLVEALEAVTRRQLNSDS